MAKKLAGFLLLLAGMFIVTGGVWYTYEAARFIASTELTTGEIVEHKFTGGLNTGFREVGSSNATQTTDMYAPIVEFRTHAGINVRFQANWSEGDPPAVGSIVPVRYPEQFPEGARISGVSSLFGGAVILFIIGGFFAGFGVLKLRRQFRAKHTV